MVGPFLVSSALISVLAVRLLDWEFCFPSGSSAGSKASSTHRVTSGRRLYQELLGVNRIYLASGKEYEFTRYKYFTDILEELLVVYRSVGANIFPRILDLRKNLLLDLKAQKQLEEVSRGSLLEMGTVFGMGAVFAVFAKFYAHLELATDQLVPAFGWQLVGFLIFILVREHLKRSIFGAFYSHIRCVTVLDVCFKIQMPINQIASRLELEALPGDRDLQRIKEGMEEALRQAKRAGGHDLELVKELATECWLIHEQKLEEFLTKLKSTKLLCMGAFFLTGYLYIYYLLVSSVG